jgi:MFS family permease
MLVPSVLVLMNVVYAFAAYPAGVLSDHVNRITVLGVGFSLLIAADLVLGFTNGLAGVGAGVALWGLHMGFTQGLLATLVADTAPPELRGTAYGMFNLLSGLALFIASVLAGALWESVGAESTFFAAALFTAIALVGLAATRRIAPTVGQRAEV